MSIFLIDIYYILAFILSFHQHFFSIKYALVFWA